MKKIAILMVVAVLTAGSTGCAHRLRDWFYGGSCCGPATAPMVATPVVMPQEYAVPTCCPPTCTVEPGCAAPVTYGQATYGPMPGAMGAPAPQTFVAPTPE
jgi:hypothetical protein